MVATQLTLNVSGGAPYGLRLATDANQRVVVDKVRKNGKADEAGLREGDVVLSINGRSCSGGDSVKASQWIDAAGSGQKVTIQVIRGTTDSAWQTSTEESGAVASMAQHLDSDCAKTASRTKSTLSRSLEPVAKSALSVHASTHTDFTITAPVGVDVQQNADRSFTVTIGMPVQLEICQSSEKTKQTQLEEQFSSKHSITFQKEDDEQSLQPMQANDSEQSTPPSVLRTKQMERILSEGSGSEPSTPSSTDGGPPRSGKKLFVDSAFYDDPEHRYPTVEEQVQLARQVAQSVLSPANLKSKGHRMFIKRKERSLRWTTGLTDEEKTELASQMTAPEAADGKMEDDLTQGPQSPQTAPLGLRTSVMFAPKLPTDKNVNKLNAMSNEELERMVLLERKTTHTNVSPQVCFNLVDDLRNMKGKGGKLFAKRQAKSETWDKSSGNEPPTDEGDWSTAEPAMELNPRIGEKLKAEHRTKTAAAAAAAAESREPESASSGAASVALVNRLKDMVEHQKAAITPWDAAAQYGSVEKAFEHLGSSSIHGIPSQTPLQGQQRLVGSLQQQQRRRDGNKEGGGEREGVGRAAVRPKSTIGCVGRAGDEAKCADDSQSRVKIEALGGNPNASGLTTAMTASLSAARSSVARGHHRSVKQTTQTTSKSGEEKIPPSSTESHDSEKIAGSNGDRPCSPKASLHA